MTDGWQPEWNDLIKKYFPNDYTDWDGVDRATLKIILDSQIKLEKITKYAKNLIYSNPHISWQLKQMLRDTPSKQLEITTLSDPNTVTYLVSCSNCKFEIEYTEESLEVIKKYYQVWNSNNAPKMTCVHDYQFKLIDHP